MGGVPRGVGLAALVAIAALADLWVGLRPDPAPLSAEVMRAAVDALRQHQKPGDLLVHSPLLRVSEVAAFGDLRISPHRPAAKLLASRRVLVVDRADHPMYFPRAPNTVVPVPASDGALELRIFEPEGAIDAPLYVLRDAVGPSTMRVERPLGSVESRCTTTRGEGGYACPNEPDWIYAATRTLRIGGEDTPCVWTHPTSGDGAIVLELPAQPPAPAGRRLVVQVSAGLTDDAVNQTPDGATVTTTVLQGGAEKGRVIVPNRLGWQRATLSIDPGAPVELRITTPKDGRRHHCLNAEILDVADKGAKEGAR